MQLVSEIMKYFIGNEFNDEKTYLLQYKIETLGNEKNHSKYYSIDESIILP